MSTELEEWFVPAVNWKHQNKALVLNHNGHNMVKKVGRFRFTRICEGVKTAGDKERAAVGFHRNPAFECFSYKLPVQ